MAHPHPRLVIARSASAWQSIVHTPTARAAACLSIPGCGVKAPPLPALRASLSPTGGEGNEWMRRLPSSLPLEGQKCPRASLHLSPFVPSPLGGRVQFAPLSACGEGRGEDGAREGKYNTDSSAALCMAEPLTQPSPQRRTLCFGIPSPRGGRARERGRSPTPPGAQTPLTRRFAPPSPPLISPHPSPRGEGAICSPLRLRRGVGGEDGAREGLCPTPAKIDRTRKSGYARGICWLFTQPNYPKMN
jgi:hypothetical protein